MSKLSNPRETIAVVSQYDFDFRKRFGQNFLVDEGVILRALEAAQVGKNDVIFEIGPGIGTLTQYLCEAAYSVAAIEIDRNLIPILENTLKEYENVRVINEDVLKTDLLQLAREYGAGRTAAGSSEAEEQGKRRVSLPAAEQDSPDGTDESRPVSHTLKIVANLPYYITTPILMNLFRQKVPARSITVMVQKEVADRMTAQPGSKDYGSLSLAVQYYSAPEIVEIVPPSSFVPRPKVTSAVVTMNLYEEPPVKPVDEELFIAVTRAAFEQRRKTLVNALGGSAAVPCGKDKVRDALEEMGKSPTVRGEVLSLEEFVQLSDLLSEAALRTD